jgi:hypothetical protein
VYRYRFKHCGHIKAILYLPVFQRYLPYHPDDGCSSIILCDSYCSSLYIGDCVRADFSKCLSVAALEYT